MPLSFAHVSAHMDNVLTWEQLSLAEQLNCMCDALAKDTLDNGIQTQHTSTNTMLPRELAAVFFSDGKATSDPADMMRIELGHREAWRFLTHEIGSCGMEASQCNPFIKTSCFPTVAGKTALRFLCHKLNDETM